MDINKLPSIDIEFCHPVPIQAFADMETRDDDYDTLFRAYIKKPHELNKNYKSFRNVLPGDINRIFVY